MPDRVRERCQSGRKRGRAHQRFRSSQIPKLLQRAEHYIIAHAQEPITAASFATAWACSIRTLQKSLPPISRNDATGRPETIPAGMCPTELSDPHASVRVAAVARKWHLGNPGRFAADYRKAFARPLPKRFVSAEGNNSHGDRIADGDARSRQIISFFVHFSAQFGQRGGSTLPHPVSATFSRDSPVGSGMIGVAPWLISRRPVQERLVGNDQRTVASFQTLRNERSGRCDDDHRSSLREEKNIRF